VVHAEEPLAGYPAIQRAFLREDFQNVTALAQDFILQHPEQPEVPRVWLWLVLSLDRLQQSQEALRELERLKARLSPRDPVWPEALYWEGDLSRRSFQMGRAKAAYLRLVNQYAKSTWVLQARLGLGLVDLHQQEFESALLHFRAAASEAGDQAAVELEARLFEGLCLLQLKRHKEAAAVFEPLLERLRGSNLAQAAFYFGESLSALGRHAEAIPAYERAVASSSPGAMRWSQLAKFGMGWAHFQLNQCEPSLRAFDAYLAQGEPDHRTEALFAQGSCLLRLQREREAMSRFEQIVSRDPGHPLALESGLLIVNTYRRQERLALAKELLHTFLRRRLDSPSRARVQLQLAAVALQEGNAAQARTVYTAALEHDELAIRQAALSGLGDVQLFLGDHSAAQRYYEEAMRVSGKSETALYAMYQSGRLHLQRGEFDEAIEVFRHVAAGEVPRLAEDATLALVIAHLNRREEPKAQALLEAIRRQRPSTTLSARALYYHALIALGRQDRGQAERLCRELVSQAPAAEEAFEARLLLLDLTFQDASTRQVMEELERMYEAESLPRGQRAKLAKRLGDEARGAGRYREAVEWYAQAADLLPALGSEAAYRIASCHEEQGDLQAAIAWYRKVEQLPWRVRGQLALAKLLERQQRPSEAIRVYEELAEQPIAEVGLVKERLAALRNHKKAKGQR
jgi:tetratricopeptide (TPR) repeat protein